VDQSSDRLLMMMMMMSSKIQSLCCMLTIKIKKLKSCVEMFKMSCVIVCALCGLIIKEYRFMLFFFLVAAVCYMDTQI
jgi:hypothetical protein